MNRLLSSVTIRAPCTAPPLLPECHYQICCASPVPLLRGDFGRFYLCLFICICWRRRSGALKIAGTPGVSGSAFGGSDSRGPSCVVFPVRRASYWKMLPSSVPGRCRGPPTGMDINQEKPHQNGVGRPEGGSCSVPLDIKDSQSQTQRKNPQQERVKYRPHRKRCALHLPPQTAPQPKMSPHHHPGLPPASLQLPPFSINNVPLICLLDLPMVLP